MNGANSEKAGRDRAAMDRILFREDLMNLRLPVQGTKSHFYKLGECSQYVFIIPGRAR